MKSILLRRLNQIPALLAVPDMYDLIHAGSSEPSPVGAKSNSVNVFAGRLRIQHIGQTVRAIPDVDVAVIPIPTCGQILPGGIERERADSSPAVPERFGNRAPAHGPQAPAVLATQMNATGETRYRDRLDVAVLRCPPVQQAPRSRIPQPRRFIVPTRQEQSSVGTIGKGKHCSLVARKGCYRLGLRLSVIVFDRDVKIPNPDCSVITAGCQPMTVRAERDSKYRVIVARQRIKRLDSMWPVKSARAVLRADNVGRLPDLDQIISAP